ncbi:hypothetical protein E8E11_010822 [Didymella keratinophila]|nr:hypothetical protein E8E11_010822 [Didymella keratinophila]
MNVPEEAFVHEYGDNVPVPYTHIDVLGTGCCGTVAKAQDTTTEELFARKTKMFSGSTKAAQEQRLRNEVRITQKLSAHHHFIQFHAAYKTRRYFGLLLKPVANKGDLSEYLEDFWTCVEQNGAELHSMRALLQHASGCLSSGLAFMKTQCFQDAYHELAREAEVDGWATQVVPSTG